LTEDEDQPQKKDDVVSRAKSLYEVGTSGWNEVYKNYRNDVDFLSDKPDSQWDAKTAQERRSSGLQVLQLDQLGQFVKQVVNDIRQNTPSINIIPDGEGADQDTAEAFKDIIRGIEYESGADAAYDMAGECAVKGGIGFIIIDHDYASENGFEQKLCIKRVVNPLSVVIDPCSTEIDGRDIEWGFTTDTIKVSEFKKKWPKHQAISFDAGKDSNVELKEDDDIMIAQFFERVQSKKEIALLEDGTTADYVEGMEGVVRTRFVSEYTVNRYKLCGDSEPLEKTIFPGKYVPIVPVYGEEAWNDGKRHLHSLVRKARPGQQMYNMWRSIEADMLLRANRAPIIAPFGATEAFSDDYKNADKAAVLRFNQYDEQNRPYSPPARLTPAPIPTGVVNASREMIDDMKGSMGMYGASIGARTNETSGIAIQRRKLEGDVATLHFGDNLVKSIQHVGRILVSAATVVYDTARTVTGIGADDQPYQIGINGQPLEGQDKRYDLTKGQYSVRVTTGASYTTKRQEEADFYSDVVKSQPDLIKIAGDLLFKSMDFPGAQALAERLKKTIPPQLLDEEGADPEKTQLTQQVQQLEGIVQQMGAKLQEKDQTLQNEKKAAETEIENKQLRAVLDITNKQAALEKKEAELKILENKLQGMVADIEERVSAVQSGAFVQESGVNV
jgi:hypothetical protein